MSIAMLPLGVCVSNCACDHKEIIHFVYYGYVVGDDDDFEEKTFWFWIHIHTKQIERKITLHSDTFCSFITINGNFHDLEPKL